MNSRQDDENLDLEKGAFCRGVPRIGWTAAVQAIGWDGEEVADRLGRKGREKEAGKH